MKRPIAALAFVGALAASPAWAQNPSQVSVPGAMSPGQPRIFPVNAGTPELTPPDQLKPPTIDLPNEPIEPYLLSKENGPFMVLARVFRGVDSERMALRSSRSCATSITCRPTSCAPRSSREKATSAVCRRQPRAK